MVGVLLDINNVFSILISGSPSNTFTSSRDLRQGYPLSRFSFILAMEGPGKVIQKSYLLGHLHGLRLFGVKIPILHQQYVDDVYSMGCRQ